MKTFSVLTLLYPSGWLSFSGNMKRTEYWIRMLMLSAAGCVIFLLISDETGLVESASDRGTIFLSGSIAVLWVLWSILTRRLHDTGRSGCLTVLLLLPVPMAFIMFRQLSYILPVAPALCMILGCIPSSARPYAPEGSHAAESEDGSSGTKFSFITLLSPPGWLRVNERISRKEYWCRLILLLACFIAYQLHFTENGLFKYADGAGTYALGLIVQFWVFCSICARRFHDIHCTGWLALFFIALIYAPFALLTVSILLGLTPSSPEPYIPWKPEPAPRYSYSYSFDSEKYERDLEESRRWAEEEQRRQEEEFRRQQEYRAFEERVKNGSWF